MKNLNFKNFNNWLKGLNLLTYYASFVIEYANQYKEFSSHILANSFFQSTLLLKQNNHHALNSLGD